MADKSLYRPTTDLQCNNSAGRNQMILQKNNNPTNYWF